MSYLKNILSIFKWSKKEKEEKPEQQELPAQKGIVPTPFALKDWVMNELPPLAWERIVLRSSKYLLQRYQKTLNDFQLNELLPQDVQERIHFLILEMYNKEVKFNNTVEKSVNF